MKNVVMSSLILLMVLPAMSFASSWAPVEEGVAVSGKVHAIKKSKKYRSVEKCRAYAETKSIVVAFTLDANKGIALPILPLEVALLKRVRYLRLKVRPLRLPSF